MRYLGARLVQSILLLVGVSLLSFAFVDLAPGNFFDEMRLNPQIAPETLAGLRNQYGLDQPLPVRYGRWLASVAKGEWGFSFAYDAPVASLLWSRVRNTLLLTGSATLLTWLFALPLGILSAEKRWGWIDHGLTFLSASIVAIPELLLALALLFVAVRTRYLPVGGIASVGSGGSKGQKLGDIAAHMIVPVTVLVATSMPTLLRHTRASMIDVLESPYVRAARSHGITRWRILFRHALPAAINPLISFFGFSLGSLLSASLLVEVIMSWPGLGPLLLEAILARDIYIVVSSVMVASLFLVCGSFVRDVLLFSADPRIRIKRMS